MNEQTQLLLKDAEYLTCPEAELIPDGVRLTALINLVRKLAEAVPTAYTAGMERCLELLPKELNTDSFIEPMTKFELGSKSGHNSCRSQASSAIQEEINKSKV